MLKKIATIGSTFMNASNIFNQGKAAADADEDEKREAEVARMKAEAARREAEAARREAEAARNAAERALEKKAQHETAPTHDNILTRVAQQRLVKNKVENAMGHEIDGGRRRTKRRQHKGTKKSKRTKRSKRSKKRSKRRH